jgi:hypothetical protein
MYAIYRPHQNSIFTYVNGLYQEFQNIPICFHHKSVNLQCNTTFVPFQEQLQRRMALNQNRMCMP